jgi:hypothetical protein
MKIVERLKNLGNGSGAVADLERAIVQFEVQRDQALAWLAGFDEQRRELLLSGDSAAVARLRTERLDQLDKRDAAVEALAKIRSSLIQARDEARATAWARVKSDYGAALTNYLAKAESALEAFEAAIAVKDRAVGEGFSNEIVALTSPPNARGNPILARELIDAFRVEWDRIDNRRGSKPASRVAKLPAPATRPAPMTDSQHAVRLDEPTPFQRRSRRELRRDPPPTDENMCLVTILRSGVDLPGKGQCAAGDRVAVQKAIAESLVKNGAADYVRPGTQVEPFPSTDIRIPNAG